LIGPRTLGSAWPRKNLGSAVEFLDHRRRPITSSERVAGPYPYYGANGQQDSVADWLFDEALVLLAEDGGHFSEPARGVAYPVSGKCWVNNHAHVLRPRPGFCVGFLSWHLAHYDLSEFVTGTTRGKLTKAAAERIPILAPPLEEQRRIADILDKADAIRRKRKEAIALTEALLRSTFLEMFGDPITNPKCWPVKPLGEVAKVATGLQVTHARAGLPRVMPYLRVANVFRDRIDLQEVKTINVSDAEWERAQLKNGDVLVVEGHGNPDELGRSSVWRSEIQHCTHQNHLIRVRVSESLVPDYVSAFLNCPAGRSQMLALGKTTSGLNTISTNNVRSLQVPTPPLSLQQAYARSLEQVRRLSQRLQSACDLADDLFSSLVQRAFAGELT